VIGDVQGPGSTASALHNMSQPPRSTVVIAPGRQIAGALRFCCPLREEDRDRLPQRIAKLLLRGGPDAHAPDFTERVGRTSATLLESLGLPQVASCWESLPGAAVVDDPALCIAVVSRCSANLFLRRRLPRLDWERLSSPVCLIDPHLAARLRREGRLG
jgi:hypothetical protein